MSDVAIRIILAGAPAEIFVSTGVLQMRQRGPWLARELVCSSKLAPAAGSPAILVCKREDGAEDDLFVGTVRRSVANPADEVLTLSLVAGNGKLLTALPPLDHVLGSQNVPAGTIARAICDAAGEVLADGVELALDAVTLPRWHRATDTTAAVALDLLAWALGFTWRVLPSGKVWMGAETWPAISGGAYWTGLDADDGVTTYSVHGAPFAVGQAIDDGRGGSVRAVEVLYQIGESGLDVRVRGAVAGDVPHVPDLDLYRGSYSATVVHQRDDGTIDVRCDDARLGELQRLAFRVGIPGATVTFAPSSTPPPRVRVRFDGASPAGAYAADADQDPNAGPRPALRVGDGGRLALDVVSLGGPILYYSPNATAPYVPVPLTVGPPPPDFPGADVAPNGSPRVSL